MRPMRWWLYIWLLMGLPGCSGESLRVAIEAQRRADQVQQTVFDRQHDTLRILLYRDLVHRLSETGVPLTAAQHDTLNRAWNERDLVEFWAVQNARARALRIVGVDAYLFGDQAPIDLLIKQLERQADRARAGLAAATARKGQAVGDAGLMPQSRESTTD